LGGRQNDSINERSDQLSSFFTMLIAVQSIDEPSNLALVSCGDARLKNYRTLSLVFEQHCQLLHAFIDTLCVILQKLTGHAVQYRLNQLPPRSLARA